MKRRHVLTLLLCAANGCDSSNSPTEFDHDAAPEPAHDAAPHQAAVDNISGYYRCAIEAQSSTPTNCSSTVIPFHSPSLVVVEHDGLVDIGMSSVFSNQAPVWHGTLSTNSAVHVTGMAQFTDMGQLTATVNSNSLRDVRLELVHPATACTRLFVGVCARGAPGL